MTKDSRKDTDALIARAQKYWENVTKDSTAAREHKRKQRLSFVYGNTHLANPNITRAMIEEADRRIHPEDYS